eukprot:2786655-Lingulodinium_polyedra.AAC.1
MVVNGWIMGGELPGNGRIGGAEWVDHGWWLENGWGNGKLTARQRLVNGLSLARNLLVTGWIMLVGGWVTAVGWRDKGWMKAG